MFCPQCHVEYRQGFTHCTDCDVGLVNSPAQAEPKRGSWEKTAWEESTRIRKYDSLLWSGMDPQFYLSLIGTLSSKDVPCLGRAASAQRHESSTRGFESSEQPEFEVRVNQGNLPFAKRVLESAQEDFAKEWPIADVQNDEEVQSGPPVLVCPLCSAEFTEGDLVCSNCGVTLRTAREAASTENVPRLLSNLP